MKEQHKAFNYFPANMAGILAEDPYPRITAWAHRGLPRQSYRGNQTPKLCTTSGARNYPHPQKPPGGCLVRATKKHRHAELRPRLQTRKQPPGSWCLRDALRRAEPGHLSSSSVGLLPSPLHHQGCCHLLFITGAAAVSPWEAEAMQCQPVGWRWGRAARQGVPWLPAVKRDQLPHAHPFLQGQSWLLTGGSSHCSERCQPPGCRPGTQKPRLWHRGRVLGTAAAWS